MDQSTHVNHFRWTISPQVKTPRLRIGIKNHLAGEEFPSLDGRLHSKIVWTQCQYIWWLLFLIRDYQTFVFCLRMVKPCRPLTRPSTHSCRLAIWLLLQAKEDGFTALFAVVCSSWVAVNAATSGRSLICPNGRESLEYVEQANQMASRTLTSNNICLCVLVIFPNTLLLSPVQKQWNPSLNILSTGLKTIYTYIYIYMKDVINISLCI